MRLHSPLSLEAGLPHGVAEGNDVHEKAALAFLANAAIAQSQLKTFPLASFIDSFLLRVAVGKAELYITTDWDILW